MAGNLPIMLRKIGALIGVLFIMAILCTWESPEAKIDEERVPEHVQSMISAQSKTSAEAEHESILVQRKRGMSEAQL